MPPSSVAAALLAEIETVVGIEETPVAVLPVAVTEKVVVPVEEEAAVLLLSLAEELPELPVVVAEFVVAVLCDPDFEEAVVCDSEFEEDAESEPVVEVGLSVPGKALFVDAEVPSVGRSSARTYVAKRLMRQNNATRLKALGERIRNRMVSYDVCDD